MKKLSLLLLLVLGCLQVFSQIKLFRGKCVLCSADLNIGYYKPGLEYLNEESYLTDVEGRFNGGPMVSAMVNLRIVGELYGAVGAGLWRNRVDVNDYPFIAGPRSELLVLTGIPAMFQLKYEFNLSNLGPRIPQDLFIRNIKPFIGIGTSLNFKRQKFEREQNGVLTAAGVIPFQSQTYQVIAGLKYKLTAHLDAGLEYNHHFGKFQQAFLEGGNQLIQDVNLGGPAVMAKITYYRYPRPGYLSRSLKRYKGSLPSGRR